MAKNTRATSSGTLLSLDDIVTKEDAQFRIVDVPEWGGKVRVRGLTARERDDYEASMIYTAANGQRRTNYSGARERLVARGLVDMDGNRIVTDEDAGKLATKSAVAMERLFDAIRELSGMAEADVAGIVGNSNGDRSADTSSK